jgi:hypothetical protein
MDWQTAELAGYAFYAKRGYRIFVSLVRGDGYDFIAEKDGQFLRVNVKVAGLKCKAIKNSWSISQASGFRTNSSRQQKTKCDVFLAYIPPIDDFIELDGDFFDSGNSKSKLIPKGYLRRKT